MPIKKEGLPLPVPLCCYHLFISKLKAGVYEYRISLRDPKEIIPWIRSFGERAQVISSGDFEIEKTIEEDWEKAVNKYEALSRI